MPTEIPKAPYSEELYRERLKAIARYHRTDKFRAVPDFTVCALTGHRIQPNEMALILRWREHKLPVSVAGTAMAQVKWYWDDPKDWVLDACLERSRPMDFETAKRWLTEAVEVKDPDGSYFWTPVTEVSVFCPQRVEHKLTYSKEEDQWTYQGKNRSEKQAYTFTKRKIWMSCRRERA